MNLVLVLLIICIQDFCIYSEKQGSFPPELRLKFVLSHCFAWLCPRTFIPSLYLILLTPFALSHHTKPLSRITLHSLILRQETISLLQNHTGSVRSAWYGEWLFFLVYMLMSNSCSLILAPLQLSLHNQPSLLPVTPCLRRGLDQLRWYIVKTKVLFVMLQGEGYSDKLEDISE